MPLDDQTRLGAVSSNVDLEAETDRRSRAPVLQSSLLPCARILARGLDGCAPVPGSGTEPLLLIEGGLSRGAAGCGTWGTAGRRRGLYSSHPT